RGISSAGFVPDMPWIGTPQTSGWTLRISCQIRGKSAPPRIAELHVLVSSSMGWSQPLGAQYGGRGGLAPTQGLYGGRALSDSALETGAPAGACFGRALRHVHLAVDDLQVRHAPKAQEVRPGHVAVLAPYPKQRDAVIDFRGLPQSAAGFGAASALQAPEHAGII